MDFFTYLLREIGAVFFSIQAASLSRKERSQTTAHLRTVGIHPFYFSIRHYFRLHKGSVEREEGHRVELVETSELRLHRRDGYDEVFRTYAIATLKVEARLVARASFPAGAASG